MGSKYDWFYKSVYEPDRQANVTIFPGGKMLGGSSSLNWMFYVRGNPADYNSWAAAGYEGWDWNTVFKYFLKSEDMQDRTLLYNPTYAPYHNTGGPVKISRAYYERIHEEKLDILLGSLSEIGLESNLDYNGPTQIGMSRTYFTSSEPPAIRSSTARAFLVPAGNRKNLYILKNAYAKRVLIDSEKVAKGVEVTVGNKTFNVYADKEVVVSAGAYNTPKILVASGIGPAQDVQDLGIDVISDIPVGVDMLGHYYVNIYVKGAHDLRTVNATELEYYPNPSLNGFFSLDGCEYPDFQLCVFYQNMAPTISSNIIQWGQFKTAQEFASDHELFIFTLFLLHPLSSGSVRIRSVETSMQPEIRGGTFSDTRDIGTFREGVKRLLNITETAYFKGVGSSIAQVDIPQCSHLEFMTDEYWDCYVFNRAEAAHSAGTCAMGKVVDNRLRVYGVRSLRVVDSSVFPSIPSANTNAPSMMAGERLADLLKEEFYNHV